MIRKKSNLQVISDWAKVIEGKSTNNGNEKQRYNFLFDVSKLKQQRQISKAL